MKPYFSFFFFLFLKRGKEKKRGKEEKIICSADYISACQDAVSFSSLFPRLILTCCGNLSHPPFIVGAERQPNPVEKKHIKRRSQVFPMAGAALDRLPPKSLRSDAKFCNGNKQQQKKTTPLGLHRSNGWYRFPWIPSIYSGTQKPTTA